MNYYVIDDVKTKVYSIFGSSYKKMPNAPAIVAVSDYNKKNIEKGCEFTTDGIVYADGTFCFGPSKRIVSYGSWREATPEEVQRMTDCAASVNLAYMTLEQEHKNIWTKQTWTTTYEALAYISTEAMRFRLNGEIVGWKEVEAYEPAEGMHFAWYHDNGYSYLGVDPAKKEDWIAAVRKIKKVWYGNLYGIVYLENGVIDVRQCSKRYSEVSNT